MTHSSAGVDGGEPAAGRMRRARWVRLLERSLWLAGAGLLGTAAWTVSDAYVFQRRAAVQLERSWTDAGGSASGATLASGAREPAARIAPGTPLAKLSIARLGVSAVVAEGVDDPVLRRALGHLPESALPGGDGNIALAGHRDTFFRALEGVQVGDELLLESASGKDLYRVVWAMVVEPSQTVVTRDAGYPALTLVTCYPFGFVGNAPYRFVIRARRVEPSGGGTLRAG